MKKQNSQKYTQEDQSNQEEVSLQEKKKIQWEWC